MINIVLRVIREVSIAKILYAYKRIYNAFNLHGQYFSLNYHIVSIGSMHMVDCVELTIFYGHLWYSRCTEKSTY